MEVIRRFRNHYLLYYYLLFLCILGSCNLKNSSQEPVDREPVEDIDEDFGKNDDDLDFDAANSDNDTVFDEKNDIETEDEDEETLTDEAPVSDGDAAENDDSDMDFPDMTGTWANLTIFKGLAKVPYIGQTLPAWAIMVSKVDIYSQENGVLNAHTEMCRLKTGVGTSLISAEVPDSFAESLGNVDKTFYLSYGENGEIRFHQDKLWEVRSCTLDDPENEPLPSDINDPRVFDADNTGINGLRIRTKKALDAEAEILQKVSTILDGVIDENGEVSGITTWYEAQSVMWYNNVALKNGAPTSPVGADPNESVFVFKRIDSSWDCSIVKEKSAGLFPQQAELYPKEFQ
ncbi:hypothetical protein J5690_01800 [bacterium]|nr:hypothetical protein [bacterium]